MEDIFELEKIVFSKSMAYENSTAFQLALAYIKKSNIETYKELLTKEVEEMGLL